MRRLFRLEPLPTAAVHQRPGPSCDRFYSLCGTIRACGSGRAKNPIFRRSPRWRGGAWPLALPDRSGAAPDRAGVGGWGKRSGGGLPTRPRRFTGLGGRAFLPRRFGRVGSGRVGSGRRGGSPLDGPGRTGVLCCCCGGKAVASGSTAGGRRKVPRDREDRLDETLDQMDQQRGQPIPAAVGGQALGDLAEPFGEPLGGGVGGWGGGVHAT